MNITFSINYNTTWGQWLCVSGSLEQLGGGIASRALAMEYQGDGWWRASIDIERGCSFEYRYCVCSSEGVQVNEWGPDRRVDLKRVSSSCCRLDDCWRASDDEKIFFTETFTRGLLAHTVKDKTKTTVGYTTTLRFQLNAARIQNNLSFAILGNIPELGNWQTGEAVVLSDRDFPLWSVSVDAGRLPEEIEYKYVLYDTHKHAVISWEKGENRRLRPYLHDGDLYIRTDEYYRYDLPDWKAAGVSIPVFSLRSEKSFGIGEFTDLPAFADWAKSAGLKIIQTLPINDTTRNHNNSDAFPYTAITVTALHPLYVNPVRMGKLDDAALMKDYLQKAKQLNAAEFVEYGKVHDLKMKYFKALYKQDGAATLKSEGFERFVRQNDWLLPYAAFCYLRDKFKTADYSRWEGFANYHKTLLDKLQADSSVRKQLYFHIWLQYHAHLQLAEASRYVSSIGLILKGDIPIGISRESVEAWTDPALFHLDRQAGAPPDPFSEVGQNWGFPTYNWDCMRQDNYAWWKKRLTQMAQYFQAFRIDHVLGFFRIWNLPLKDLTGLLGQFDPALPMDENEIRSYGIDFEMHRMSHPYIRQYMLDELFGEQADRVANKYLDLVLPGVFRFKEAFNTQRKLNDYFAANAKDYTHEAGQALYNGLMKLHCEVLFVEDLSQPGKYHPRIGLQNTRSFKDLDPATQDALNRLYTHFHYTRHNEFWRVGAMRRLSAVIHATRMLPCAEDLGMIPDCVPQVMHDTHILSLEIDRISKKAEHEFMQSDQVPYLSVCTSSTHDMNPIRNWWTEDRDRSARYYRDALGEQGQPPAEPEAWLCQKIFNRLLGTPSMLTIIPWQDWMAIDGVNRKADPEGERINNPAGSGYWKYRMHLSIEELGRLTDLSRRIQDMVHDAKRDVSM